jgi:hypothetical protein
LERLRSAALGLMLALTTFTNVASAQSAPASDSAATAAAAAPNFFRDIQANAFASFGYISNLNQPQSQTIGLRYFDTRANTFSVDLAELVVQKAVANPGDAGFRLDLTAGTFAGLTQSAGLRIGESADLQQAFVSYIAPIGSGLRFDVGKHVTHMGYELIEGYDGYNDHYSRGLLFGYAIPFTHTGAKLSYPLTPTLGGMLMVANGWDNVKDNNSGKTFGAQLSAVIGEDANAWVNYVGGPEQAANNSNWRHVIDVIGVVRPAPGFMVGVNADYGFEKDAVMTGSAQWYGAAVYGKWDASETVSLALRGEALVDDDGARTGAAQTIFEGTLSPSLKLGSNVVLRGDLRLDRSDVESYMTDDAASKQQVTIALNALGIL